MMPNSHASVSHIPQLAARTLACAVIKQALSDALNVPIGYIFEDKTTDRVTIGESDAVYITKEEREFVESLRKINDEEYKKSLKVFMKLAAEKKKKS